MFGIGKPKTDVEKLQDDNEIILQNPETGEPIYRVDLVNMVASELEKRKKDRLNFELQWILNINFHSGNQYCEISEDGASIIDVPRLYWYQERETYNHIAPITETRLAKLGRVDPSLKTRPASGKREDISAAKTCTSILRGTYSKVKMQQKIKYATYWSELIGTVFYMPTWDPGQGRIFGTYNGESIKEGDLSHQVINSFEIYPDSPHNEDVDQCRSILRSRAVHVEEIYDTWNKRIPGREVEVWNLKNTNMGVGGLGYTANTQRITPMKKSNHELVSEFFERPSRNYPEGRYIVTAGKELLFYGNLPYAVGEDGERAIPLIRQVCIERPGYFWGISIIERLIPIQRSYNAIKNRKHEFLNRCVHQVLVYPSGSIDVEMIEAEGIAPGSHIEYQDGKLPPQFMQNGDLPTEFEQEETRLENMFTVISGVSTFARESAPPVGANSGVAMEIIREQDDTRISLTAEYIRLAVMRCGQYWLRLYKQYAKTPRILKYTQGNEVQAVDWQASDITTDDVVIETENELAQTPAQRRQMVFDLMNAGIFNDPDTGKISRSDRAKILEMVELGNWESSNDIDQEHINKAQRENMFLEKGQIPAIFEYDDDMIHLQEHLKYMLTTEFETLSSGNPQLSQQLLMHLKQHEASFQFKNAPAINTQQLALANPEQSQQVPA
ncbi:MAG: hypothetical protein SFH39_00355 [Candidatus Magnetobacterium sp. LHC-1]